MAAKSETAYWWIRDQILSGARLPRASLNADDLSRTLGFSKIPIREALRRLTSEGLVTYRHNAGAIVTPLSWQELRGIRAARGALEPAAARAAAGSRTDEQLDRLHQQLDTLAARVAAGDLDDFFELNRTFHLTVAGCAGMPVLAELIDLTLLKVNRYRAVLPATVELAASDLVEHRAVVAAIRAGDADAAESAARTHVTGEHTITGQAGRIRAELFDDQP